MSGHTPGPWGADGLSVYGSSVMPPGDRPVDTSGNVVMGGRFRLAELYSKGVAGHFDEVYANAKLIAAAPELAEAVQRLLKYSGPCERQEMADRDFARAALAKAGL